MDSENGCVYKANGYPEAQQIRAFLEAHEIPCVFRGESLYLTHALTLDGLGLVKICVAEPHFEQARELLARADAGELRLEGQAGDEIAGS